MKRLLLTLTLLAMATTAYGEDVRESQLADTTTGVSLNRPPTHRRPAPRPTQREVGDAVGKRIERVRRRVQMLMMWRLTEVLALTPDQGARFFPLFNTYQNKIRLSQKRLQVANEELRIEASKPKPDNTKLAKLVADVVEFQGTLNTLKSNQLKETLKVLSPAQQAKMLLFLPRFNKLIRQLVQGKPRPERRRVRTPKP